MSDEFDFLNQETPAEPEKKQETPQKEGRRPGSELFELFQMIMCALLVALIAFNGFGRITRVDGSSMDNTLENGEMMIIWSLGYHPKAGDIVVLNKKNTDYFSNRALIKRVIATGGQRVDIDYTTGTVYVDGLALDEPYIREPMYLPADAQEQGTSWEVPEGSVFVMGDNRNNSSDSRHEALGPVDESYILGKAVLALWPFSRLGLL